MSPWDWMLQQSALGATPFVLVSRDGDGYRLRGFVHIPKAVELPEMLSPCQLKRSRFHVRNAVRLAARVAI